MNYTEIKADIDFLCDTSDTEYTAATKAANVNRWYDKAVSILLESDGRWQWDDTNWSDYPVGTTTLVDGRQDYEVFAAAPASGSDYLRIMRVEVMDINGDYNLLTPLDQSDITDRSMPGYSTTAPVAEGMPRYYDKLGPSLFLYPVPATGSVTMTAGLKVFYQRSPSYFVSGDTTKIPGFPSIFHRYLSLGASLDYAVKKQLPQKEDLKQQLAVMEESLKTFLTHRNKDERLGLTARTGNFV